MSWTLVVQIILFVICAVFVYVVVSATRETMRQKEHVRLIEEWEMQTEKDEER